MPQLSQGTTSNVALIANVNALNTSQYISILIEPHISNLNVPVLVSAIIDPVDSDILTRAPLSPALPVFFLAR